MDRERPIVLKRARSWPPSQHFLGLLEDHRNASHLLDTGRKPDPEPEDHPHGTLEFKPHATMSSDTVTDGLDPNNLSERAAIDVPSNPFAIDDEETLPLLSRIVSNTSDSSSFVERESITALSNECVMASNESLPYPSHFDLMRNDHTFTTSDSSSVRQRKHSFRELMSKRWMQVSHKTSKNVKAALQIPRKIKDDSFTSRSPEGRAKSPEHRQVPRVSRDHGFYSDVLHAGERHRYPVHIDPSPGTGLTAFPMKSTSSRSTTSRPVGRSIHNPPHEMSYTYDDVQDTTPTSNPTTGFPRAFPHRGRSAQQQHQDMSHNKPDHKPRRALLDLTGNVKHDQGVPLSGRVRNGSGKRRVSREPEMGLVDIEEERGSTGSSGRSLRLINSHRTRAVSDGAVAGTGGGRV